MNALNGHKKVLAVAAGLAAICSVLSFVGGTYNGWTQRVEASVVTQRMVNAHDESLKTLVPKVDACHGVNEVQQVLIEQDSRDISALAAKVERLVDKIDLLVQSQMREGRVPR